MADTDPAATLRRAAELAPTVLPPEIGALVAQKITLALDSPMRVANLHPHYARLAAEVLALAEQQQPASPPPPDTVETVARAICNAGQDMDLWGSDQLGWSTREDIRAEARAAIAAMRGEQ